jgi:hypothetical protein
VPGDPLHFRELNKPRRRAVIDAILGCGGLAMAFLVHKPSLDPEPYRHERGGLYADAVLALVEQAAKLASGAELVVTLDRRKGYPYECIRRRLDGRPDLHAPSRRLDVRASSRLAGLELADALAYAVGAALGITQDRPMDFYARTLAPAWAATPVWPAAAESARAGDPLLAWRPIR